MSKPTNSLERNFLLMTKEKISITTIITDKYVKTSSNGIPPVGRVYFFVLSRSMPSGQALELKLPD
jgi:hypothetical protein